MPGRWSVYEFLREARVPHTVVPYGTAAGTSDLAATHLHDRHLAKVITCLVDGEPIEAVLPAPLTVNLNRLLELAGGSDIRLAQQGELQLQTERAPEAVSPSGPIYRQSVFVDVALASESKIVLNVETHAEAICVRWADFAKSVRPIVGAFAGYPGGYVGAYRLSYRE